MEYTVGKITQLRSGEKNGKTWTLNKGEFTNGTTTVEASFFGTLPEGKVEGEISEDQYGKKFTQKKKGGGQSGAITAAQNRKSEMISTAQDNKERAPPHT